VERHHLDQITEREATLFNLIEQSTLAAHRTLKKALADLAKGGQALSPLEASLIATRLDRSLKTTYELLEVKGRIHENKRGPGIIRARAGVRTDDGRETMVEVQVQP